MIITFFSTRPSESYRIDIFKKMWYEYLWYDRGNVLFYHSSAIKDLKSQTMNDISYFLVALELYLNSTSFENISTVAISALCWLKWSEFLSLNLCYTIYWKYHFHCIKRSLLKQESALLCVSCWISSVFPFGSWKKGPKDQRWQQSCFFS